MNLIDRYIKRKSEEPDQNMSKAWAGFERDTVIDREGLTVVSFKKDDKIAYLCEVTIHGVDVSEKTEKERDVTVAVLIGSDVDTVFDSVVREYQLNPEDGVTEGSDSFNYFEEDRGIVVMGCGSLDPYPHEITHLSVLTMSYVLDILGNKMRESDKTLIDLSSEKTRKHMAGMARAFTKAVFLLIATHNKADKVISSLL